MKQVPDQIVHYSRGQPFLSITSVSPTQLDTVMSGLHERNAWGLNRFLDENYLKRRIEVENKMRRRFVEKDGEPELLNPIYFFLGRNSHFEENPLNVGYAIELSQLDKTHVSFSYGDTMLSFNEEYRKLAGEKYRNLLCNDIYMVDELESLINDKLFPIECPLTIEAHLWIQPSSDLITRLER
jgi:hypothetical protein